MSEINNLKIKPIILLELATTFVDLTTQGTKDQYPINFVYVFPSLSKFRTEIFLAINKNIDYYHETMLAQILLMLILPHLKTPSDVFNLVIDKLIEKRKDPTLKNSLDLTYLKEINLEEITDFNLIKKHILWAELNTDIEYPILRGFGFNIYTINDIFYKEYNLSTGKFVYSGYINEKPEYFITCHNIKPSILSDHKCYGTLPSQPSYLEFEDDADKIKYTVDKFLLHLGVNKEISKNDVLLDIGEIPSTPENLTSRDRDKLIQELYLKLKIMCDIE